MVPCKKRGAEGDPSTGRAVVSLIGCSPSGPNQEQSGSMMITRVKYSLVIARQLCSDEAGLRSSQWVRIGEVKTQV